MAHLGRISETPKGWIVPSESGKGAYLVYEDRGETKCNCPDCQLRKIKCKHQWAVEYFTKESVDELGNKTVQKAVRMTYTQDWRAYNEAQTNEIRLFDQLLSDLVKSVEEPERKRGRPNLNLQDELFCAIQKVYSQLSQRRAYTLYHNAEEREQVSYVPHFNAVGKLLNREDATPILHNLLILSSLPMRDIELYFSQDSSGFRTSQFTQYALEKYGATEKKHHKWLKAHILVGNKTNVIVNAEITDEDANDSPYFKPMVEEAYKNGFNIKEITADMGYLSRKNYDAAYNIGADAYIPFKSNATGRSGGSRVWNRMYYYFMLHRDEFNEHYHQRSNVETTFMMVKTKFGDKLKSKNLVAQKNELLCKLIAHNVVVLIHEMYELGVTPDFSTCTLNQNSAPKFIEN